MTTLHKDDTAICKYVNSTLINTKLNRNMLSEYSVFIIQNPVNKFKYIFNYLITSQKKFQM
jgi:hypothetical protein